MLTRPLLQPDDFEYLGAFKLPQCACGLSTAYASAGMAMRRVNGNLQFLTCTHVYDRWPSTSATSPAGALTPSTWPQATIVREWGTAVYGNPSVKPSRADWTCGLSYDQATGRLYYSYASGYNVAQTNIPSLGCAVLDEAGPVVSGPWLSQNVTIQVMRGGSLMIPDWFADTYLAGRKLGVGFGGGYSGWAACSPGPTLAAAHHPAGSATQLDTIRLLQYDQTDLSHWATRDADYWSEGVYNLHNPVGDVGYWISMDSVGAARLDRSAGQAGPAVPDQHGPWTHLVRLWQARRPSGHEAWWWVYDPADLAEVAQGHMDTWEPQHDSWMMQYTPRQYKVGPGCAFDAQTRTLFVIAPGSYRLGGQEWYPLVHGYRIKTFKSATSTRTATWTWWTCCTSWMPSAASPGDANYDARCDFNSDGCVDVVDLLMLVENFGT